MEKKYGAAGRERQGEASYTCVSVCVRCSSGDLINNHTQKSKQTKIYGKAERKHTHKGEHARTHQ